ncbi:helix-turn-helix domain-containing protein [Flavobacterium sp. RHBU_24]|uniref:helix-turn-helix domain-containing protein n=1 Tax=Flavobacterium sp. RHBU_24 TaxID=3391185 RepID=UPI0039851D87
MQFDFGLHSSLLLVFLAHLLVYSGLCLRRYVAEKYASDFWLSLLLLLTFLYVCPWMLGFAGWYSKQPFRDILFYVPFQHLYAIGPAILFYVLSLLNPGFSFRKKFLIHFIPAGLYIVYSLLIFVYDKLIFGRYYFLADERDRDFDDWYQISGFISMIIYFVAALRFYLSYRKIVLSFLSNADAFSFTYIRNFLIAVLCILVSWCIVAIYGLFFRVNFLDSWWHFLFFSIFSYYVAIAGYSNAVRSKLYIERWTLRSTGSILLAKGSKRLQNGPSEMVLLAEPQEIQEPKPEPVAEEYPEWLERINALMESEKCYEDPELSLPQLAARLQLSVPALSRIVNKGSGRNFNDFINGYRVSAVMALLTEGAHKKSTILGLAYDCGFNSKSTFNRAFRKQTGLSPKDFVTSLGKNK